MRREYYLLVGLHAVQVTVELGAVHHRDARVQPGHLKQKPVMSVYTCTVATAHLSQLRLVRVMLMGLGVIRIVLIVTEIKQRSNL